MGFSPQLVDLNGDGHDDIISGSYSPGTIYVFDGNGKGEYAKARELEDAAGNKLTPGPEYAEGEDPPLQGLASVPYAYDYDADGDFDLISGNIIGEVILIENVGTATAPKFSEARIRIKADGDDLVVSMGDSGPVIADWDADGKPDLIVGAGDGSVTWYRNTGTRDKPVYAEGIELIESLPMESDDEEAGTGFTLMPGQEPLRSGTRSKVCVTDYNRDGLLDLLVGDVRYENRPEPDLTDEQRELREKLEARLNELNEQYNDLYQQMMKEQREAGNTEEYINIPDDDERFTKLSEEMSTVYQELSPLQPGMDLHGWVWFYQRKPMTTEAVKTAKAGPG